MSIRTSPQLTPATARRRPLATAGAPTARAPRPVKQNSKMNALEHGERSAPENHYAVMRALGEDPAQFDALKQELRDSFGPGDAFLDKQVDDLARLYWRRDRLERSQTGLMRRALLALEEQQHRRRKEIEDCHDSRSARPSTSRSQAPADPAARLRLLLSFLGADSLAGARPLLPGLAGRRAPRLLPEEDRLASGAPLCYLLSLFAEAAAGAPLVGARLARGRRRGTPRGVPRPEDEDDVGASLVDAEADGEGGHRAAPTPQPSRRMNCGTTNWSCCSRTRWQASRRSSSTRRN